MGDDPPSGFGVEGIPRVRNRAVLAATTRVRGDVEDPVEPLWRAAEKHVCSSVTAVTTMPRTHTLWAAGYDDVLIVSRDRGDGWESVHSNARRYLRALRFIDDRHGCAAGWRAMLYISDRGRTCSPHDSFPGIEALAFVDGVGIAVGWTGGILRTVDRALTWHPMRSRTRARLRDVWIHDSLEAITVGEQGTVLASGDGGRTWRSGRIGTSVDLRAIGFVNRQHRWIACGEGMIAGTNDGGRTWHARYGNAGRGLFSSVVFADARTGWALGSGLGVGYAPISRTNDGRSTWQPEFSGSINPLYAVTVVPGRICAGSSGSCEGKERVEGTRPESGS